MLIVPLHRPLTRKTFPFVTAALIVINVLIYFGWQLGDDTDNSEAMRYYVESGLAEMEQPVFMDSLRERGANRTLHRLEQVPEPFQKLMLVQLVTVDEGFEARMRESDALSDPEVRADWENKRGQFDQKYRPDFNDRYTLRYGNWSPLRMFTSAFLHGSPDHLIGNMIFLGIVGLLVELPLGAGLYALLYLIGIFGASIAGLAWNAGEVGSGLGASGAIAALMGAMAVLWGMRKVRVFYWFYVVFDYVKVRAIWLLPLWLGWQLLSLALFKDSNVAFDVHAGGIVTGALTAFVFGLLGWVRHEAMDEPDASASFDAGRTLRKALSELGQMQLDPAIANLQQVIQAEPQRSDARLALVRAARMKRDVALARAQVGALLALEPGPAVRLDDQVTALDELVQLGQQPASSVRLRLVERLIASGRLDEGWQQLEQVEARPGSSLPQRWLQLAIRLESAGDHARAKKAAQHCLDSQPDPSTAGKAGFLLRELGV